MCDSIDCMTANDHLPKPVVTDLERRAFLAGAAALPLASVLAWPDLAKAAGENLAPVTIPTASGGTARGLVAMPATTPAPTVVLIHEWWGLNDNIKAVAAEFANLGYIALAIDLYQGKVATDRDTARQLTKSVSPARGRDELTAAIEWLRGHEKGNGKVGTIGWCFGGGWSLNASLATPVDATVIYYGRVNKSAESLASLKSPVLGHFGTLDKFINRKMVSGFEAEMAKAGKTDLTVHWYDADHAFANPTGGRYDADDAKLAWERTLAFFKQHLG